jgi:hypothetical protein
VSQALLDNVYNCAIIAMLRRDDVAVGREPSVNPVPYEQIVKSINRYKVKWPQKQSARRPRKQNRGGLAHSRMLSRGSTQRVA